MFPQDLGRVFLNMFTNAFDALFEKKKHSKDFQPLLRITTLLNENEIEIRIYDNGPGISEKYQKKIFDPFFTTKPSGRGTGLGLSLSYDIITRQHFGTITLNTEEDTFSEFVITLPIEKPKGSNETELE
jgi:signal transduction histidine kinase